MKHSTLSYLLSLTLAALFASTASAQKAEYLSDDLRVFELRGKVKSVYQDYDRYFGSVIEFDEDGDLAESEFEVERDDEGRIDRILSEEYIKKEKPLIDDYRRAEGCEIYEAEYYNFGSIGASVYYVNWENNRPTHLGHGMGGYCVSYEYGTDGTLSGVTVGPGLTGDGFKTYKYRYTAVDKYGNWTSRVINGEEQHRTIQYYDYESELQEMFEGGGTLSDIEDFAHHMRDIEEYRLCTEATELWNRRAIDYCRNSSDITTAVESVTNNSLATDATRRAVAGIWCAYYLDKMRSADDPTPIVREILTSNLSLESTRIEASNYWNERAKSRVDRAKCPTEEAAKYVDSDLMKKDYRDYILATVYNYEISHHVNGVTDYEALYREADIRCGSYDVFNEEQRATIIHNADALKRTDVNRRLVKATELLRAEQYEESRKQVLDALAIEPDYDVAIEMRAEVEYKILWRSTMAAIATVADYDTYFSNNPNSKYTFDLQLVRELLLHLDHKYDGPRSLYKKILKNGVIPPAEKVRKVVMKCKEKDLKE